MDIKFWVDKVHKYIFVYLWMNVSIWILNIKKNIVSMCEVFKFCQGIEKVYQGVVK